MCGLWQVEQVEQAGQVQVTGMVWLAIAGGVLGATYGIALEVLNAVISVGTSGASSINASTTASLALLDCLA